MTQITIVGKNNGEINLYSIHNGDLTHDLIGHSSSVSDFYLDFDHKIVISGGSDSRLLFQKENESNPLLRMQDKAHLKNDISLLAVRSDVIGKLLLSTFFNSKCFRKYMPFMAI